MGWVKLCREGLYYRVFCRCRVSDGQIHRLYADGENLGVLIPDRGELMLETRVVAKRLKEGCTFSLDGRPENFIPIRPGSAFAYLDRLRTSKLAFRNAEMGLVLM